MHSVRALFPFICKGLQAAGFSLGSVAAAASTWGRGISWDWAVEVRDDELPPWAGQGRAPLSLLPKKTSIVSHIFSRCPLNSYRPVPRPHERWAFGLALHSSTASLTECIPEGRILGKRLGGTREGASSACVEFLESRDLVTGGSTD